MTSSVYKARHRHGLVSTVSDVTFFGASKNIDSHKVLDGE